MKINLKIQTQNLAELGCSELVFANHKINKEAPHLVEFGLLTQFLLKQMQKQFKNQTRKLAEYASVTQFLPSTI